MTSKQTECLVVSPCLTRSVGWQTDQLAGMEDRHHVDLNFPTLEERSVEASECAGSDSVVMLLDQGLPNAGQLSLAEELLLTGMDLYFYWSLELGLERLDGTKLSSYRRHCRFVQLAKRWLWFIDFFTKQFLDLYIWRDRVVKKTGLFFFGVLRLKVAPLLGIPERVWPKRPLRYEPQMEHLRIQCHNEIDGLLRSAKPLSIAELKTVPNKLNVFSGCGAYLRLDFWAKISSGGSYGHTCYVAKNLAATSSRFFAFMAHRYTLLDAMGVRQFEVEKRYFDGNDKSLLKANGDYFDQLLALMRGVAPNYIYERICLGSYVGAKLSQRLAVPYIVEYNGSEISMKRTFESSGYEDEDIYLKAEELAFAQATVISVVSETIRQDLIARGVDPDKIVTIPNGADPEIYAPPTRNVRAAIRNELGFRPDHRVIGFSGTFGGWHGVEVLAASLPKICSEAPEAMFLLIGDGNLKYLVDKAVEKYHLEDRVYCVGRVPQALGAQYLQACDVFVSPHSAHMIDSSFFGSPTKIFEYMSMARGIVASDLGQIGEVLNPAIRVQSPNEPTDAKALLCKPGDIDEFIEAVLLLVGNEPLNEKLGNNARAAIQQEYSWERHVDKLWAHTLTCCSRLPRENVNERDDLVVDDPYKLETQNQWDNDACGSHYVTEIEQHTLDWYKEVERYRYHEYAPWMPSVMGFARHAQEKVLEIGAGIGTDLAQFAENGAFVTDIDLSGGHLAHAKENFALRGLSGEFVHQDAEVLPFEDDTFDLVYSNGVIHHTPNTEHVVEEIYRVLRPGGRTVIMVYAENSLHYWRNLVFQIGVRDGLLGVFSMAEIMSQFVEISDQDAKPLVKVYTGVRVRNLFSEFDQVEVTKQQLTKEELPFLFRWLPTQLVGQLLGWNLIIKASKAK